MASKTRARAKRAPSKAKRPRATKVEPTSATRKRKSEKKFAEKIAKHSGRIDNAEDRLTQAVRKSVAKALRDPGLVMNHWFDTASEKTKEAMAAVRSAMRLPRHAE